MKSKQHRMRIVVDTNIVISRIINKSGTAGRAFDLVFSELTPLASSETIAEVSAKLSHEKFFKYSTESERADIISIICERSELVDIESNVTASPDPTDNKFLALAVDGRADYIVSGDKKHLLFLKSYEGIPILSPAAFLAAIEH